MSHSNDLHVVDVDEIPAEPRSRRRRSDDVTAADQSIRSSRLSQNINRCCKLASKILARNSAVVKPYETDSNVNKKPTNWQNGAPLQFDPKPPEVIFSAVFANFDECRSEVAGDVLSGVAVHYVGMDVRSTFGECGLNSGRFI